MKNTFLLLSCLLLFSSCSHQLRLKTLVKNEKFTAKIANNDASRRNAYFIAKNDGSSTITLSEPPPDAIVTQLTEITNKLKIEGKIDTEQSLKLTEGIVQLGQRTVAVNILRDALFRLNEMNVNHNNAPMDDISYELFKKILEVAENISVADKTKAESEKIEADAKLMEAKTRNNESVLEIKKVSNVEALENEAFEKLANKDIQNAHRLFHELESSYPGYHNAYEISKLLSGYMGKAVTNDDWNAIFSEISQKFSWGMPEKFKNKF